MAMSRNKVRGMALKLVPNRGIAVVTLDANTPNPVTVTCSNAWIKQTRGGLSQYGAMFVEQDKTVIKILDSELNPAGNGRQIRARDKITFGGENYVVTAEGGNLKSVRTVWDCVVQKEFS